MLRRSHAFRMFGGSAVVVAAMLTASCGSGGEQASPAPVHDAATLDDATRAAILAALDDERRAQATYRAVIRRHGSVRPFSNIVNAEGRHEQLLLSLCRDYGITPPPDPYDAAEIAAPESLREACRQAVESERTNIALYDRLLPGIEQPDVKSAFETLRRASAERHLPAFARCAGEQP